MSLFIAEDGKGAFSLESSDVLLASGSRSFEFRVDVCSHGYCAKKDHVWFEEDAIKQFVAEWEQRFPHWREAVKLAAMTDFEMSIHRVDRVGHFECQFHLIDPFHKNSAEITLALATGTIDSLVALMKDLVGS